MKKHSGGLHVDGNARRRQFLPISRHLPAMVHFSDGGGGRGRPFCT